MLTKLKAVNIILDSIGEEPVNSLSSGLSDAETAERILDEIVEDVLESGWNFNTEFEWTVTPDSQGRLVLPEGTLRADTDGDSADIRVAVRQVDGQSVLYDIENQTFTFEGAVTVTLVQSFEFDDLPHAFKKYCALKAAGEFQQREMGSQTLDAFLRKKIDEAWERVQDADADDEDANILRDSPSVAVTTFRINRYRGV